jgi:hypothetical protein
LPLLFQPQLAVEDVGLVEYVVVRIAAFDLGAGIGTVAHPGADALGREFGDLHLHRRLLRVRRIVIDGHDGIGKIGRILDLPLQGQQAVDIIGLTHGERIDVADDAFRIAPRAGDLQCPNVKAGPLS